MSEPTDTPTEEPAGAFFHDSTADTPTEPVVETPSTDILPVADTPTTDTAPVEATPVDYEALYRAREPEYVAQQAWIDANREIIENPILADVVRNPQMREMLGIGPASPPTPTSVQGMAPGTQASAPAEPTQVSIPEEYANDPVVSELFKQFNAQRTQLGQVTQYIEAQRQRDETVRAQEAARLQNTSLLHRLGSTDPSKDAEFLSTPSGQEWAARLVAYARNLERTNVSAATPTPATPTHSTAELQARLDAAHSNGNHVRTATSTNVGDKPVHSTDDAPQFFHFDSQT